jgi:DinB superfamily
MPATPGKTMPDIAAEIEANLAQVESLANGLSISQFNWSPEPGRWSIGQNLAHLTTVNGPCVDSLRRGIEAGRAEGMTGIGPFYYSFLVRQFVSSQEPPVKRKFKAPKYFQPPTEVEPVALVAEYRRISEALQHLAHEADGLHLDCVKVDLPAFPPLLRAMIRMPLGARFELLTAHDRRHLAQAGESLRDPRFPRF